MRDGKLTYTVEDPWAIEVLTCFDVAESHDHNSPRIQRALWASGREQGAGKDSSTLPDLPWELERGEATSGETPLRLPDATLSSNPSPDVTYRRWEQARNARSTTFGLRSREAGGVREGNGPHTNLAA